MADARRCASCGAAGADPKVAALVVICLPSIRLVGLSSRSNARDLLAGFSYHRRNLEAIDPAMTHLLEKALREVDKLPTSEQDAVAAIVLQELASEQKWAELFAKSQDALAKMADEALAEHRSGKTKPL